MAGVVERGREMTGIEDIARLLARCVTDVPSLAPAAGRPIGDGVADEPAHSPAVPDLIPAAVLVPLVVRPHGLSVLLTQRTAHLEKHAGQISFPGGHVEPHDPDFIATALRETEEETGLARHFVQVVGALDECHTGTGYRVVPIVGVVRPGFALAPDAYEVAEVFEVPLAHLFEPANHGRRSGEVRGRRREWYEIAYGNRMIWGATAAMLVNFHARAHAAEVVEMLTWRNNT